MQWTELILTIPAGDIEAAESIALMAAPGGIYTEDLRTLEEDAREVARIDLIDEDLLRADRSIGRVHLYLSPHDHPAEAAAFLDERLLAAGINGSITRADCRSEDWENNWKAYFHPIPVGQRLLIQPAWEEPDLAAHPGRAMLLLEPGAAFGSGSHATTRLCLEALEKCFDQLRQNNTNPPQVLDIGCGSGILTVAALLLGTERAVGVDIDELAVASAKENGRRNGFEPPALTILHGDLAEKISEQFDIVVSNIVADAILALAPAAARCLKPGGVWISSGIIDTRAAEVISALTSGGWRVTDQHVEGGWVCLTARQ